MPRTHLKRIGLCIALGLSTLLPLPPAQAQDAAKPVVRLIAEAEDFKVTSPGWSIVPFRENYFASTFAISFLSRLACLGAPEQLPEGEEAVAEQVVELPYADTYEMLARYADIIKTTASEEIARLKPQVNKDNPNCSWSLLESCNDWIGRGDDVLAPEQRAELETVAAGDSRLSILVRMQRELAGIWESSSASSEKLMHDLQDWCQRAQQSGNERLAEFALRLRQYAA